MQRRASLLGVLVLAGLGVASWVARAELVFDGESQASTSPPVSEKSQVAQPDSVLPKAPPVVSAPAVVAPQQSEEYQSTTSSGTSAGDSASLGQGDDSRMTRAELLRRARMREEIKNEDSLRARLEELRLREEQRLHDRLLRDEREQAQQDALPMPQSAPAPVQAVEVVKAPVTEQKSESVAQVSSNFFEMNDAISGNSVSFTPTGGVMLFTQATYGFDVRSRFSLGMISTIGIGSHFALEGGYHFSQYGISALTMNPFVNQLTYLNSALAQPFASESIVMNQHMADLGGRIYFLPREMRIRPFISAGMAYAFSSTNYNSSLISAVSPYSINLSRPYELHTLYGQVGAGVDFQITRHVAIGALGKYYAPFAAWQNNPVQYGGYYLFGADRAVVGGTLGATPLVSVQASASFTF